MKKDYCIRSADKRDFFELTNILKAALSDWSPSVLQNCFAENYFQRVICLDDHILGFVVVKNNLDHWEIMQMAVDKQFQQLGLASRLLQSIIDEAKKLPIAKLQLELRRSNIAAMNLYLKLGFKPVGIRKKYYPNGEDAILMDRKN